MILRELIQLAVESGDRFYHPESRFIHKNERIPLFQNFCYVLGLFRTKQGENVEKAFDLLERLLAFQAEGFPIFLDQYPKCYSKEHQAKVYEVLSAIQKHFHSIMRPEMRKKVEVACKLQAQFAELKELSFEKFHPATFRIKGEQRRVGADPKGTFSDIVLGFSQGKLARWVREDPWLLIEAALLFPFEVSQLDSSELFVDREGYEVSWGDEEQNHSLLFSEFDRNLSFVYSDEVPEGKSDRMEVSVYLNYHPDNMIFVNGERATTFQMNDRVEIRSGEKKFVLEFTPGEGEFFGHISRYSRPTQERKKEMFESHDWRIGIRTISRKPECQLKVGLSEATPIACSPLST